MSRLKVLNKTGKPLDIHLVKKTGGVQYPILPDAGLENSTELAFQLGATTTDTNSRVVLAHATTPGLIAPETYVTNGQLFSLVVDESTGLSKLSANLTLADDDENYTTKKLGVFFKITARELPHLASQSDGSAGLLVDRNGVAEPYPLSELTDLVGTYFSDDNVYIPLFLGTVKDLADMGSNHAVWQLTNYNGLGVKGAVENLTLTLNISVQSVSIANLEEFVLLGDSLPISLTYTPPNADIQSNAFSATNNASIPATTVTPNTYGGFTVTATVTDKGGKTVTASKDFYTPSRAVTEFNDGVILGGDRDPRAIGVRLVDSNDAESVATLTAEGKWVFDPYPLQPLEFGVLYSDFTVDQSVSLGTSVVGADFSTKSGWFRLTTRTPYPADRLETRSYSVTVTVITPTNERTVYTVIWDPVNYECVRLQYPEITDFDLGFLVYGESISAISGYITNPANRGVFTIKTMADETVGLFHSLLYPQGITNDFSYASINPTGITRYLNSWNMADLDLYDGSQNRFYNSGVLHPSELIVLENTASTLTFQCDNPTVTFIKIVKRDIDYYVAADADVLENIPRGQDGLFTISPNPIVSAGGVAFASMSDTDQFGTTGQIIVPALILRTVV